MDLDKSLANYFMLLTRVDSLCRTIASEFAGEIACRPGCSACCRHISLFPVEAYALAYALSRLPAEKAATIREQAANSSPDTPCPLLDEDHCLLYDARPLICRTHGFPIIIESDSGSRMVDFCPENFRGISSLPGRAIIDLDLLNQTLSSINSLFLESSRNFLAPLPERNTIAKALLLPLPPH